MSTLIAGVATGITMIALMPKCFADIATPCAWFPAEHVTTPLDVRTSAGIFAILLYAPLILNENTGCVSSRFKYTVLSRILDRTIALVNGVSIAIEYTCDVRIFGRYSDAMLFTVVVVILELIHPLETPNKRRPAIIFALPSIVLRFKVHK